MGSKIVTVKFLNYREDTGISQLAFLTNAHVRASVSIKIGFSCNFIIVIILFGSAMHHFVILRSLRL